MRAEGGENPGCENCEAAQSQFSRRLVSIKY